MTKRAGLPAFGRAGTALAKTASYMRLSVLGPFTTAAANFLLAAALIPYMPKEQYGFFGFTLVVIQFSFNLSNALTATPMAVEISQHQDVAESFYSKYSKVSLLLALLLALAIVLVGLLSRIDLASSVAMGIFGFLSSIRWFGRTLAFTKGVPRQAMHSDMVYSVAVATVAGFAVIFKHADLAYVAASLSLACLLSKLTLGRPLFSNLLAGLTVPLSHYAPIWRTVGSWSTLQVVLMEMTANAHAYLVVLIMGPTAYAPLAVGALFWRPTSTVLSSVAQLERPKIARHLKNRDFEQITQTQRNFWGFLFLSYFANMAAAIIIILSFLEVMLPHAYSPSEVVTAATIWSVMMFARCARVPGTVLCQACGEVRKLARIGIVSAPVSLLGALAILTITRNAELSLIGIAIGECSQAIATFMLAKKVSHDLRVGH